MSVLLEGYDMRPTTIASSVLLALMLNSASEADKPLEVRTELDETRFLLMQRDRSIAATWNGAP